GVALAAVARSIIRWRHRIGRRWRVDVAARVGRPALLRARGLAGRSTRSIPLAAGRGWLSIRARRALRPGRRLRTRLRALRLSFAWMRRVALDPSRRRAERDVLPILVLRAGELDDERGRAVAADAIDERVVPR